MTIAHTRTASDGKSALIQLKDYDLIASLQIHAEGGKMLDGEPYINLHIKGNDAIGFENDDELKNNRQAVNDILKDADIPLHAGGPGSLLIKAADAEKALEALGFEEGDKKKGS